jgi:hypothetical protein
MPHSSAVCIGRKVETVTWKLRAQKTIVRCKPCLNDRGGYKLGKPSSVNSQNPTAISPFWASGKPLAFRQGKVKGGTVPRF